MNAIHDEVTIHTTPERAYAALSTQAGYLGWWSKDCEIGTRVGAESRLRFDKGGTIVTMRFRTDALEPGRRVAWTCIGHDMPSWIGTTLEWTITAAGADTRVALTHAGWKDDAPDMVVQGWKHFLASMKKYLETGTGEPW